MDIISYTFIRPRKFASNIYVNKYIVQHFILICLFEKYESLLGVHCTFNRYWFEQIRQNQYHHVFCSMCDRVDDDYANENIWQRSCVSLLRNPEQLCFSQKQTNSGDFRFL